MPWESESELGYVTVSLLELRDRIHQGRLGLASKACHGKSESDAGVTGCPASITERR